MKEKECPCLMCQDRAATCHISCKRYESWKSEHQKYTERINEERNPQIRLYINERHYNE